MEVLLKLKADASSEEIDAVLSQWSKECLEIGWELYRSEPADDLAPAEFRSAGDDVG